MKVYRDIQQGTTEWRMLRLGIPTASQFHRIITPAGKDTAQKTRDNFMFELLAERLSGNLSDDYKSFHMIRGTELETRAVKYYEFQRELTTEAIGFVSNDSHTIGASPDRFVADDGSLEIKAPSAGVHCQYLLKTGYLYDEHRIQVQGQLWITDRKWSDLMSYFPEMPEALVRIERDEEFIAKLSVAVGAFSAELERLSAELVTRGWMGEWRQAA